MNKKALAAFVSTLAFGTVSVASAAEPATKDAPAPKAEKAAKKSDKKDKAAKGGEKSCGAAKGGDKSCSAAKGGEKSCSATK